MNHSTIAQTLARGIRLIVVAALLGATVTIVAPPPVAAADPFDVDTNADDLPALTACTAATTGDCSLRGAIDRARTNPGPDTITFAAATNGIPIVLTGLANEDLNASGDLDILDGGDLTIQGNAANTIVDGGGTDRVFHVCPDGGCTNTVLFKGVTIQHGDTVVHGGGIYNAGGTTTVDGSTIRANTAVYGSGISNEATLTVTNGSTIGGAGMGNVATWGGGGIYNQAGTTTVDGSTVSANTADKGGGIYVWSGSATVDGSTVISNTSHWGGGIYNRATLTVQNGSAIGGVGAGNEATDKGGGIYNYAGSATVDGSTVSANTADWYGGGIYNRAMLSVQNGSTIGGVGAGNQATVFGGGIYNDTGGTTTVDGSTVSANTAVHDGGGIWNYGLLDVTNSTIGGSGAANQANDTGGGIYNHSGSTTVTGSCILNNRANINGGGLYNDENSTGATKVTGSSIVGNSDTSFFNNQGAEQTATGNWWGAAAGPNKPGADTVDGPVDTGDYLTEPIPDCLLHVYLPLVLDETP